MFGAFTFGGGYFAAGTPLPGESPALPPVITEEFPVEVVLEFYAESHAEIEFYVDSEATLAIEESVLI
jgi:hypothetical protein